MEVGVTTVVVVVGAPPATAPAAPAVLVPGQGGVRPAGQGTRPPRGRPPPPPREAAPRQPAVGGTGGGLGGGGRGAKGGWEEEGRFPPPRQPRAAGACTCGGTGYVPRAEKAGDGGAHNREEGVGGVGVAGVKVGVGVGVGVQVGRGSGSRLGGGRHASGRGVNSSASDGAAERPTQPASFPRGWSACGAGRGGRGGGAATLLPGLCRARRVHGKGTCR